MPKRKHDKDSESYLRKKLRKIEKKLRKNNKKKRTIALSSSSSDLSDVSLHEDAHQGQTEVLIHQTLDIDPLNEPISVDTDEVQAVPSTSQLPEPELQEPELDGEILELMGETPSKEKKYGTSIQKDLAIRWEHICTSGLTKDTRKELLDKHLIPDNCRKIDAPALNPEVKAAISDWLLKKDKALESKQKQTAASISCLGQALTKILTSQNKDQEVIKLLLEAGRLICDTQYKESLTRRSFICTSIKKELKDQLEDTDIDKLLFSEKLPEALNAAKAINKSANEMKNKPPTTFTPIAQKNKTTMPKNTRTQLPSRPTVATTRHHGPATNNLRTASSQRHRQPPPPPPRSYNRGRPSAHRR